VKLFRHFLIVFLVAQMSGLPWLGLQAVSKARQTYRNAQAEGIAAAIKQVPKGKGNCGMCKKIKLAKAQQDRQQRAHGAAQPCQSASAPAVLPPSLMLYPISCDAGCLGVTLLPLKSRLESPPTPPPRWYSFA